MRARFGLLLLGDVSCGLWSPYSCSTVMCLQCALENACASGCCRGMLSEQRPRRPLTGRAGFPDRGSWKKRLPEPGSALRARKLLLLPGVLPSNPSPLPRPPQKHAHCWTGGSGPATDYLCSWLLAWPPITHAVSSAQHSATHCQDTPATAHARSRCSSSTL